MHGDSWLSQLYTTFQIPVKTPIVCAGWPRITWVYMSCSTLLEQLWVTPPPPKAIHISWPHWAVIRLNLVAWWNGEFTLTDWTGIDASGLFLSKERNQICAVIVVGECTCYEEGIVDWYHGNLKEVNRTKGDASHLKFWNHGKMIRLGKHTIDNFKLNMKWMAIKMACKWSRSS